MRIAENSGCQLDVELEPYRTLLSSDLSVAEFQGGGKVVMFILCLCCVDVTFIYIRFFINIMVFLYHV